MKLLFIFAFFTAFVYVKSIPIDNEIVDPINIQCASDSVTVSFDTRNPWQGILFVKNHFERDECKVQSDGTSTGTIFLGFDGPCGLKRERSVEPRGVFVWVTVIMSFHPRFVTKVDRAVRVECFYMEADKTVEQEIEVGALTTVEESAQVAMPVCRYEILDGEDGSGSDVRFAFVGQKVYHKWTCESDNPNTFCMSVYNCFVDDGSGDRVILLDQSGCALDVHLLDSLDYQTDLMAGQGAHVFKYADRSSLFFNCQIRIDVKDPGQQCRRPDCPLVGGIGVEGNTDQQGYGPLIGQQVDPPVRPPTPTSPSAQYPPPPPPPIVINTNIDPPTYPNFNQSQQYLNARAKRYSKMTADGDGMVELERYTPMNGAAAAIMEVSVPYPILVGDVDLTPDDVLPSLLAHRTEWLNTNGQGATFVSNDNLQHLTNKESRDSRSILEAETEMLATSTIVMLVIASLVITGAIVTIIVVACQRHSPRHSNFL